jgi:Mlc titration factor MtfA (ptsG expression regulator)
MLPTVILPIALLSALLFWFWRRRRRAAARRAAYLAAPFPARWEAVLRRRLPCYTRLPPEIRRRLRQNIKLFLAEKEFTACGGLRAVGNDMAVTIAGHACLLLAGREPRECFPEVASVLVYPDFFHVRARTWNSAAGVEMVRSETRLGEASPIGSVVLSWRETLRASALAGNGNNLVLHEFAHHLRPVGAPLLAEIETGFQRLRANPEDPVLDSYGAENKDEFWAVSVEAFFEAPHRLRETHPALYAALSNYFSLSPAEW